MLRRCLIFLATLAAFFGGNVLAQTSDLPSCDFKQKAAVVQSGGAVPDFRGCDVIESRGLLIANGYHALAQADPDATGIKPATVTRQTTDGKFVRLLASTGQGYQPPVAPLPPAPDRLSLFGKPRTIEGGELNFKIVRDGDNGGSATVGLQYSDPGLLEAPPAAVAVTGNSYALMLKTVAGIPGDGAHRLTVRLIPTDGGAAIGEPAVANGIIDDTPVKQHYDLRTVGSVVAGEPLRFAVSRTDPIPAAELHYEVVGGAAAMNGARRLSFGRGLGEMPIVISPDEYDACAVMITIKLTGAPDGEILQSVSPTGGRPGRCEPRAPWGWIIAGIVAAIGLLWLAIKLVRGRRPPFDRVDKPDDPLSSGHVSPVTASCAIAPEPLDAVLPIQLPAPRWPTFTTQVTLDPGATSVPDPLPITERTDD